MNKKYLVIIGIICAILTIFLFLNFNKEDNYEYVNLVQSTNESVVSEEPEEKETIKIHILGEVNYNGILELEVGSRIYDAIEKAGGITDLADVSKVNLAYILEDGEKIYIPNVNDQNVEIIISETSSNTKVNINTADEEELENIPGVGPSIAKAIVDYRKENGKFKNIEDIKNVSGVGESKYKKMEEYIKIK